LYDLPKTSRISVLGVGHWRDAFTLHPSRIHPSPPLSGVRR
jgi:hypothetical protein